MTHAITGHRYPGNPIYFLHKNISVLFVGDGSGEVIVFIPFSELSEIIMRKYENGQMLNKHTIQYVIALQNREY